MENRTSVHFLLSIFQGHSSMRRCPLPHLRTTTFRRRPAPKGPPGPCYQIPQNNSKGAPIPGRRRGGAFSTPKWPRLRGAPQLNPAPFLHHRGGVLTGLISTHVHWRFGRGALFCARSLRESRWSDGGRKPDPQIPTFARSDHAPLREALRSLAIITPRGLGGGAVLGAR